MTITIESVAEMLNDHSRMFATDLQTKSRLGLEMETMLPQRQSTGEYYVVENAEATELLQGYQPSFTPKGTISHDETKIRIRPIKLDIEITEAQLEKWYYSWQVSHFDAEKDPLTWTYPRSILEAELLPKFRDDLNRVAWLGEYAAPTPGTASDAVDAVDGYKKIIADSITSGAIPAENVVSTGALSSTNIREKVEDFLAAIPDHITAKGGKILMAPAQRRNYVYDYRGEFSQVNTVHPSNNGPRPVFADDYNIELVSVATMAGSSRLIFLPNGRTNMVWCSRAGSPVYPQMIFKAQARVLQMYATIYRGFGFEYPKEIYVNDQA